MSVFTDLKTAIPLAGSLTIYFYFKPSLPLELSFFFFGVWTVCFVLDAKITISNAKLMTHEKNLIFPILYYKFGPKISPIIQCFIEGIVMVFVVILFEGKPQLSSISVVSLVFGFAHLHAYLSNIITIKKILKS